MDYKKYEEKIEDVLNKAPLENGIEILAYNILDECIDSKKYSVIDINRAWKEKDSRYDTEGGIPDILVVTKDFWYKHETAGKLICVVEVKYGPNKELVEDKEQLIGQMKKTKHYILTNGSKWIHYEKEKKVETFELCKINGKEKLECTVNKTEFEELKDYIKKIKWEE